MKRYIVLLLMVLLVREAQAQLGAEWMQQKKTQKKYLIKQILELQVYIKAARKGYDVAKKGLTVIGDLKNGEFKLHDLYFTSLGNVNPRIKKMQRVADIIRLQEEILSMYEKSISEILDSDYLNNEETDYIKRVYERLLKSCEDTIEELKTVVRDNELKMKDDERIKKIEALYVVMQSNYVFCKTFAGKALALAGLRQSDQGDLTKIKELNQLRK